MSERPEKIRMELRRGVLVLAVLGSLRQEHYAYSLRRHLADAGLEVEEGTLYPLVRRLESQGLLLSEWREAEGRRRRYYRISDDGRALLESLDRERRALEDSLRHLLEE